MRGEGRGCGITANEYSCAYGAQKKFGAITPYLTYAIKPRQDDQHRIYTIEQIYEKNCTFLSGLAENLWHG
jgi:hypothetical protein